MPDRRLQPGETVVTAYGEPCNGPGWANSPIWIVVRGTDGRIRMECLQPSEQTRDMLAIYAFSALAHGQMTKIVQEVEARRA